MELSRRVILSSAAAGSLLLASGCVAQPTEVTTTPPSGTAEESSDAPTGEILLGMVNEVPVGMGQKFTVSPELTVLVTQPREGVFRGFNATCTHAGCIVSGVREGEIACGCHGARYDIDSGEVTAPPAPDPLAKIILEVRGEELWLIS